MQIPKHAKNKVIEVQIVGGRRWVGIVTSSGPQITRMWALGDQLRIPTDKIIGWSLV